MKFDNCYYLGYLNYWPYLYSYNHNVSPEWATEFDMKHQRKAEGQIGRNIVGITIKIKSIVRIFIVINDYHSLAFNLLYRPVFEHFFYFWKNVYSTTLTHTRARTHIHTHICIYIYIIYIYMRLNKEICSLACNYWLLYNVRSTSSLISAAELRGQYILTVIEFSHFFSRFNLKLNITQKIKHHMLTLPRWWFNKKKWNV